MKFQLSIFKNTTALQLFVGLFVVIFLLLLVWGKLGYPFSLSEGIFLSRIKSSSGTEIQQLNLSELMPGEWEMVCESNGYDEPLYVQKYKKTFPNVGAMQDGAWGLLFIRSDGTFSSVSSSCGAGVLLKFSRDRCLLRGQALLVKSAQDQGKKCEKFVAL